ncbi:MULTISPECIES: isochorismate synthase [Pseudomonas]|uniref:isochorismate synthase n=1 Tax=Pseudomonas peradeniyensis TaxID=2745488 RepID=A0ABT2V6S3_9PSED|nr:isochorismate synthase MenF [Pseudomonas peradeniyensis]MCU7237375.1 isochorismate synthase MenF [Pseudomonas peradeniyensis]MCU7278747.1 isochorismate synthase MenF [Pseudomonas peradeniyensis]
MKTGTLRLQDRDTVPLSQEDSSFSFTSGDRELSVSGLRERIDTPANGSHLAGSALRRSIDQAFERARQAGQDNPIVVGAIPFDTTQACSLYVPQAYAWQQRTAAPAQAGALPALHSQTNIPDEHGFKRAVCHAIVNFQHSDVRKAVLSVQRELHFAAPVDPAQVQANLKALNREGYHFRVPLADGATLLGVSPELLVHKQGTAFVSNPLAGSVRRMADPAADRANAQWLAASEKDHYEHRLVTEDIAQRVGELCSRLQVPERPSLISTAALWHLSTRIEGELATADIDALQLACRLHPTPAVCGYPTERARQLIRFVEPFERGLFTGMVGWCDAQGNGEWVVTIRCGTFSGQRVRLFAGAGIVEASSPDTEWNEVQTKLGTMLRACGLDH